MDSYAVIGLGTFGSAVALELMDSGCEVLAMDHNEEKVQRLADHVTDAVVADARDESVLRSLEIGHYDCCVVCIGEEVAGSILVTLMLKELGARRVVCKAADEIHKKALPKVGADRVVIPEKEMASRFARSLVCPSVMEYFDLSDEYAIVERNPPDAWIGKSLRQLNIRAKYGVSVIAFRRAQRLVVSPHPDELIRSGDMLVLLGQSDDLNHLAKL